MKSTKIVRLIIALLAVMLVLTACTKNPDAEQTDATDPTGSYEELTVSTPYGDLKFPGQWEEQIKTEYVESDDGGVLTFSAQIGQKEAELFAVVFSSQPADDSAPVGVLTGGDAPVMVSLKIHELEPDPSWTDAEQQMAFAMQDECNYLLEQLQAQADFDMNYESYFTPEDPEIKTPFCTLSYPGRWEDCVRWEFAAADKGGILNVYGRVAAEDVLLFSLCFGAEREDSISVGSLKTGDGQLSVSLAIAEPKETAQWTAEDWDDFDAMQEMINDLMASLFKNPDFVAL